jgi:hypothetical protein
MKDVRYVLVARDVREERLAVVSTDRSLTDLAGLLRSFFAQYPLATTIEIVLPGWPSDQTVDDQETMVAAGRSDEWPGALRWLKVRDLRAIEADIDARLEKLAGVMAVEVGVAE